MSDEQDTPPENTTPADAAPRGPDGRWVKGGGSPNAGGRPKTVKEAQDLASKYVDFSIETLVEIIEWCREKPTVSRAREARQCAVALLDRACGKPAQPIGGIPGQPIELGGEAIVAALKKIAGEE